MKERTINHNPKYTEIFKLAILLAKAEIPYILEHRKDPLGGYQISYPHGDFEVSEKGVRICSAVEHSFSYGNEKDLIEIMGLLTPEEWDIDGVVGDLTAKEVYKRISKHWKENKEEYFKHGYFEEGGTQK